MVSPSRIAPKFVVRFEKDDRSLIEELARTRRRSMNSEILVAIENHLTASGMLGNPQIVLGGRVKVKAEHSGVDTNKEVKTSKLTYEVFLYGTIIGVEVVNDKLMVELDYSPHFPERRATVEYNKVIPL